MLAVQPPLIRVAGPVRHRGLRPCRRDPVGLLVELGGQLDLLGGNVVDEAAPRRMT